MNYNFDEIIDRRHTNALNTDGFRGYIFHAGPEKVFAFKDEEFVRMWVADMEFGVAPEILDALRSNVCVPTVDGVKKRVRPGMGRCQGGFCSPQVVRIIAEFLGVPLSEVRKSSADAPITFGPTKSGEVQA